MTSVEKIHARITRRGTVECYGEKAYIVARAELTQLGDQSPYFLLRVKFGKAKPRATAATTEALFHAGAYTKAFYKHSLIYHRSSRYIYRTPMDHRCTPRQTAGIGSAAPLAD